MTIRESIQKQKESIKNRSLKERISYFWEYYAIKSFAALLALITVIAFLVSMATQKDYAFTGMFFGVATDSASEAYLSAFAEAAGIDTEKYLLTVQTGPEVYMDQQISPEIYQSMEAFTAMVSAQSVDCFAGNEEIFLYYAYLGYAEDLRDVLSSEELSRLSADLYYIDLQLIRDQDNSDGGYADAYMQHPDPTKPELMKDPVPVAVSLKAASQDFLSAYRFSGTSLLGICKSSAYQENAVSFLRYVFAESIE